MMARVPTVDEYRRPLVDGTLITVDARPVELPPAAIEDAALQREDGTSVEARMEIYRL